MIVSVNMTELEKYSPRTYRTAIRYLDIGKTSGEVDVDLDNLPEITRREITEWKFAVAKKAMFEAAKPAELPAPPAPPPPASVEKVEQSTLPADFNVGEYEKQQLQKATDQSRAIERLNEYQAGGLEDTQANANLIRDFVQAEVKGYLSREIIDVAIQRLGPKGTGQLTWRKIEQSAAPPPAEPQEVLGTLRNGEPQLPLDVSAAVLRKASVSQIKDWQARKRVADNSQYLRPAGGFGSKF